MRRSIFLLLALALVVSMSPIASAVVPSLSPAVADVVAGTTYGYSGDGGPAVEAQLYVPGGLAFDGDGNMLIADTLNDVIRRVDATTGVITTIAGTGTDGYSGDGGPAIDAELDGPFGISLDTDGNIFFTENFNHIVRRIDKITGNISTYAGTGVVGTTGDGGAATSAKLGYPRGLVIDGAGNVFITDHWQCSIRRIDSGTGVITRVAGSGTCGYSGDGSAATSAQMDSPYSVVLDGADNMFIADTKNNVIRRVDSTTGNISTYAGDGTGAFGGDGGQAAAAQLYEPRSVALDAAGNLYIGDFYNHRIRQVDTGTGVITTLAGGGTNYFPPMAATDANLYRVSALRFDDDGKLYFADEFSRVWQLSPDADGDLFTDDVDNFPLVYSRCANRQATIMGDDSDNVLNGTSGNDVIMGLGGNDTIKGRDGHDRICAGPGVDTVYGGSGRDRIFGNGGGDMLYGSSKRDRIIGGKGADQLWGNRGADVLNGGPGFDVLRGGSSSDQCFGGEITYSC